MPTLQGLSSDDCRLWVVKWFDDLFAMYGASHSNAIKVLLQEAPADNITTLKRLPPESLREWFRNKNMGPNYGKEAAPKYALKHAHIFVSDIALLRIGDIFQSGEYIGSLRQSDATIDLIDNDDDLRPNLKTIWTTRPSDWDLNFSYCALNSSEYGWVKRYFGESGYLLISSHKDQVDYIIPRSEIFRVFYAGHSVKAKTFTLGSLEAMIKHLVVDKNCENGQITAIIDGQYYIVLQGDIPDIYANLIALYRFDEYAIICAKTLFRSAQVNERITNTGKYAPIAARIPYQASPDDPVTLQVKGWYLGNPDRSLEKRQRVKFLVTSIVSCQEPNYVPLIHVGRGNNNQRTANQTPSKDDPIPFANCQPTRAASSLLTLSNDDDPDRNKGAVEVQGDSFFLKSRKPLIKQQKKSNKSHNRGRLPEDENIPDIASSGPSFSNDTKPSPAKITMPVRSTVDRFRHLRATFEKLVTEGILRSYAVESPHFSWQLLKCGGEDCWSFLSHEQATTGNWPCRHWIMIQSGKGKGAFAKPGVPRCAFIVRLEGTKGIGYWIEIESRPGENYAAALLIDVRHDVQDTLRSAIHTIQENKGRKLDIHLGLALQDYISSAHSIHHQYEKESKHTIVTATSVSNAVYKAGLALKPEKRLATDK